MHFNLCPKNSLFRLFSSSQIRIKFIYKFVLYIFCKGKKSTTTESCTYATICTNHRLNNNFTPQHNISKSSIEFSLVNMQIFMRIYTQNSTAAAAERNVHTAARPGPVGLYIDLNFYHVIRTCVHIRVHIRERALSTYNSTLKIQ